LFAEFDECQLVPILRDNRFCRVLGGILVERIEMSATAKQRGIQQQEKGELLHRKLLTDSAETGRAYLLGRLFAGSATRVGDSVGTVAA
jgi:hypothetical protein